MKLITTICALVIIASAAQAQQPWIVRQTWIPSPVRQYFVPYTTQPTFQNVQYQRPPSTPVFVPTSYASPVTFYGNWSYQANRAAIQAGDAWYQMNRSYNNTGHWIPMYYGR
ncbi:MAG: hypothetical protein ABL974_06010 [Prosthecobacter sp.]